MVVKFVVFQLILLLAWPAANSLEIVPSYYSKPGCQNTCGGVTIPYPFGVGNRSCYHDEWFEIVCHKNITNATQSIPFLKKLNLQVLKFGLPAPFNIDPVGSVHVKSPILSSNCNGSSTKVSTGPVLDLRGSTFVFSQRMNNFAAVGRNNRAVMKNIEPDLIGCTPSTSNCSDAIMNCCETTIPSDLKVYNADFESIGGAVKEEEECRYAFLVETGWLNNLYERTELLEYNSSTVLSFLQSKDIPVVLDWTLLNWEGKGWDRDSSFCYTVDLGNQYPIITQYCYCFNGFVGNAYLFDGCHDINECKGDYHGCPDACENTNGGYRCVYSMWKKIIIALGSILGLVFVIICVWKLYKINKRRQKIKMKKQFFKRNGGLLLKQQLSSCESSVEVKLFASKELENATDHFNENRILGQGGQGTVYKGMLSDGRIVAVKKSKIEDKGKIETFINEVVILSQINHRNVVKLLGCCLETEVPLLVYEFIPNGTLSQYLQCLEIVVTWEMRLQIAIEIAGALSYLHSAASFPIYHRDIKSANILLDDKYRAKIADFGTSRSVDVDQTHLTTLVHGTFGYLDPEYFQSSQYTDKSDVYSFGVVLVELLTGEKAISSVRIEEGIGLATHFITKMEENCLFDILDDRVANHEKEDEIVAFANLAKRCLHLNGRNRPTMREVHMELERISMLHKVVDCEGKKEELESDWSQENEQWDTLSTSTIAGFDGIDSSADAQPLVPNPTR